MSEKHKSPWCVKFFDQEQVIFTWEGLAKNEEHAKMQACMAAGNDKDADISGDNVEMRAAPFAGGCRDHF